MARGQVGRQADGAEDEPSLSLDERGAVRRAADAQLHGLMLAQQRVAGQLDGLDDDDDDDDDPLAPAMPRAKPAAAGSGQILPKLDDDGLEKLEGEDIGDPDLDVSDEEPDTDHLVLCQFEKVTRVKNKRKCNLKDGIMLLNGREYLFHKATGEFDW